MSLRVFLTGGTGYIGASVLDAFVRGGHKVTALVRDREKLARAQARGAEGVLGELGAPKRYMNVALEADVIVHTALDHARGPLLDRELLDRLLPALGDTGSAKTLIYTSGNFVIGSAPEPFDETVSIAPAAYSAWRAPLETAVLEATTLSLRTVVVRPGIVYGGGRGIISDLLKDALNGLVRVVGSGKNHWPCVYDRDLADLYVRVAQSPEASGVYHANDEADESVNDIVEAIASHVSPTPDIRHMPLDEARAKMGGYADALVLDQRMRSPRARALGWAPTLRSVSGNISRLLEEHRNAQGR